MPEATAELYQRRGQIQYIDGTVAAVAITPRTRRVEVTTVSSGYDLVLSLPKEEESVGLSDSAYQKLAWDQRDKKQAEERAKKQREQEQRAKGQAEGWVDEATVNANPMNQPQGKLMTAGAQQQAAAAGQPAPKPQPVVQPKPVAQQPVVQQKPQPQPAVQPNQPQTQTADVDTTGGDVVSETAKALVGFTEAVGYGRNAQKGDGYSYAHKDKGGKSSSEVGDLKPPTYRDPEEKEGDYNDAYNTELMRVKSGTDREAGTPVSIKTRGKDAGDPIGEDEVEAPEASVTAYALASFMESVGKSSSPKPDTSKRSYDTGTNTRPDNKKDFVKTGQEDAKGDFPFKKHRYDKDPGEEGIPGGATKEQLVRPKKS